MKFYVCRNRLIACRSSKSHVDLLLISVLNKIIFINHCILEKFLYLVLLSFSLHLSLYTSEICALRKFKNWHFQTCFSSIYYVYFHGYIQSLLHPVLAMLLYLSNTRTTLLYLYIKVCSL